MKYDFDQVIDRRHTSSMKWDMVKPLFGHEDILPMWVADMDFLPPAEAVEAVKQRAALGIYGYSFQPEGLYPALVAWEKERHDWNIEKEWIVQSPGVVTSLSLLVELLTEPGGGIIIQPPVYHPFYDVIRMNGRTLVKNPLKLEDGQLRVDFAHLEQLMADDANKCLMLCSPHNPGGRVWTRDELARMGELALKYNVRIICDEIHQDLVFSGHKHIPLASLSPEIAAITATCVAPSKTFNVAGLHTSFVIISDRELRHRYIQRQRALSLHMNSFFGGAAAEACYRHGAEWLDQLLVYLEGNLDYTVDYFARNLPQCKVIRPEGTYLVWVDCRAMSTDPEVLKKLMFEEARVAFNEGSMFGEEGRGFLRINIACPRSLLEEGLRRFAEAVNRR
jgi:cystathionine beta-lyase